MRHRPMRLSIFVDRGSIAITLLVGVLCSLSTSYDASGSQDVVVIESTRWFDYTYGSSSRTDVNALFKSSANVAFKEVLVFDINTLIGITPFERNQQKFAYIEFDEARVSVQLNETPVGLKDALEKTLSASVVISISKSTIKSFSSDTVNDETSKRLLQTILGSINLPGLFDDWKSTYSDGVVSDVNGQYTVRYVPQGYGYQQIRGEYLPWDKTPRTIVPDIDVAGASSVYLDKSNRVTHSNGNSEKTVKLQQRIIAITHESFSLKMLFDENRSIELSDNKLHFEEPYMIRIDSLIDYSTIRKKIARSILKEKNRSLVMREFNGFLSASNTSAIEKTISELGAVIILSPDLSDRICEQIQDISLQDSSINRISVAIVESEDTAGLTCLLDWLGQPDTNDATQISILSALFQLDSEIPGTISTLLDFIGGNRKPIVNSKAVLLIAELSQHANSRTRRSVVTTLTQLRTTSSYPSMTESIDRALSMIAPIQ